MSQYAMDFTQFDAEAYFVKRLGEHGYRVFDGVTTREITKARIREAILEGKFDCTIIGRNPLTQKPETYAQAFERAFNEPLHPKTTKGKRS